MDNSGPIKTGSQQQVHRGVWHAQPLNEKYLSQASSLVLSAQSPASEYSEFLGGLESEIRSNVILQKDGPTTSENAYENVAKAVFLALDTDPIWINHLLTRRRPDLENISFTLQDIFDDIIDYMIIPFEDIYVIIRIRSVLRYDVCAIITVEPAYAGGEVCYWLRCCIYEGSENTSRFLMYVRCMASFFELLDYPDSSIISDIKYLYSSESRVAAYAAHPDRTQTLFIIPRISSVQRSSKFARGRLVGALIPFGILGELSPGAIREITGIKLPKERCAIALPPIGSDAPPPQIVLKMSNSDDVKSLNWSGMEKYIRFINNTDPAWLSEGYEIYPMQFHSTNYARVYYARRNGNVQVMQLDRNTAEYIRATTDQNGWDLYSPLPLGQDPEGPAKAEGPPSFDPPPEPSIPDAAPISDDALGASVSDVSVEVSPHGGAESGYPTSLSELPSWVERTLSSKLELAPRAVREMKKIHHPQPERIAQALELLAGPRLATFQGDRSSTRAFHQGLETLRLRDGFSGAERLAGRTGSDYVLSHRGKTWLLERHLASNSSGFNDPKMIRVYYFYDQDSDKIIVGWLPTHLQTSKS